MQIVPRTVYPGVFLLALSVILLQIALTRVYAIMMWHHLTYMVISIALLGFGAAGSILTVQRSDPERPVSARLASYSCGYGLSALLAFWISPLIPIDSLRLWQDKANLLGLLALYLVATLPFLLAGMALGLALTRFVRHVNRVYFTDLVGSGVGGAASVALLASYGGSTTIVIAATIGLLAAVLFAVDASRAWRLATAPPLVLGLLACLLFTGAGEPLGLPHWQWHPPFAAGKEFTRIPRTAIDRLFSATAEVEVGPENVLMPGLGGDMGASVTDPVPLRIVGQDGTAPTALLRGAGDLESLAFVRNTQAASAYVAAESLARTPREVLVIGVGGGVDVMIALLSGAREVTAVELNTGMIEAVTERYEDYIGGLFDDGRPYSDRVRLINSEGRSWVRSQSDKYDIIQMSGVDSFTALSTGAYTLSESYLYTVEAVQEFYEHLNDGGYVNYSRILIHGNQPRETLRLANIAYTALEEIGIEDPASHIAVFAGFNWASTMIKRGAFTRAEADALRELAAEEGFIGFLFDPTRRGDGDSADPPFELSASMTSRLMALMDQWLVDRVPGATTERVSRMREGLLDAEVLSSRGDQGAANARISALAEDFSDLVSEREIRNIITEVGAIRVSFTHGIDNIKHCFRQTLTGSAAARQAFVESYPYDITPCTDDDPFFFNYFRFSDLFRSRSVEGSPIAFGGYVLNFPVGHAVLLASLVQIGLLGVLMIFLPLRRLQRDGVRTTGSWRYFAYFAGLGMGFMFVEIVLMQKVVIFLGHPTYAISVVLASLLAFAGLGSLLSGKLKFPSRRALGFAATAIAAMIVGVCLFLNTAMPALLGLPFGARVAIIVAVILPLGLVLGLAFPIGMRIVGGNSPQLLPWCWAINGFLSVFSSLFCIVLSMSLGFTVVLLVAAGLYLAGLSGMPAQRAGS